MILLLYFTEIKNPIKHIINKIKPEKQPISPNDISRK